jgi:hypothetical protein
MSPAVIALMAAIQGLIAASPDIIAFAGKVKLWIRDMFSSGLITAAQQQELHDRVTTIVRDALNGDVPSHWQVEADPQ